MEERISGRGKRRRRRPLKSKILQNGFNFSGLPIKPELPRKKVHDRPLVPNCTIKQPSKTGVGQTSIESSEDEWSDSSFYDLPETLKDSLHRLVHPAEFILPVHMVSRPPRLETAEAHHIHAFLDRPVFDPLNSTIIGDNQEIPGCSPEMHQNHCQATSRNQPAGSRTLNGVYREALGGPRKFDGSLYYRQSTGCMLDGNCDGNRNYEIPPGNVYQDVSYPQQSSLLVESQIKVPSVEVVSDNPSNRLSEESFNHTSGGVLLGSGSENSHHFDKFKTDLILDGHASKSDKLLRMSDEGVKNTLQCKNNPADDLVSKKHSPWSVSFATSVNGADHLSESASFPKDAEVKSPSHRELRNSRGEIENKGPYLPKQQQHQRYMPFLEQSRKGLQIRGNHDVKAKKKLTETGRLHLHQERKFASKNVPLSESSPTRAPSNSTGQRYSSQQQENLRSIELLSFYSEHNLFNSPGKPSSLQRQSNVRLRLDGHKTLCDNQEGSTFFRHKKDLFQRQSNVKVTDFTGSGRSSRYTEDASLTIEELLSNGSVKSSPENFSSAKLVTLSDSNRPKQKEHPVDDFVDDQGRLLGDLSLTDSFSVDTSRRISSALWAMKLMEAAHTISPNSYEELFIRGRMFRRWFEKTRLKRTLRQEDEVKLQCAVAFWQKKKQHKFFEAWLNAQREETEKADTLRRKQMLCKGLRAMRFAVEQRKQSLDQLHTRTDFRIMAKYWLKWQRQVHLKATARLREAFDKWQMFKLEQNRDKMLEGVADRHVLFKNYTKWKLRYNIEQKNGVASLHYKISLLTKSWHSWRLYTSQSVVKTRFEELARVHYEEFLQARLFAIWKENTSKSTVAHSLSSKRIVVKAFHCWKNWTQYAKIIRLRFQSMCKEYHRHKLMKQSFNRWQVRLLNRRADRRYRNLLQGKIFKLWFLRYKRKVIHRHLCRALAKKGKKRRFFNRWSNYTKQQQERRIFLVAKLGHWLKSVVFTNWKQHVKRKKFLGNSQLLLTLKRSRLTTRKVMDRWMLAVKVANFTRKARLNWSRRCARKACEAWKILLKRKYLEHRLMDNRKIWQLLILKGMFKKWKQEKRKVDEEDEKTARLQVIMARSCKARVLHAWRVTNQEQQIISPMVARRERRQVARVFDAWRLHIHRQRNIVDQKTRAKEKMLDKYFLFWRERAYLSVKERTVQGKLLESKLSRAFSSWRSYVKEERHNRIKARARRFQLMGKYYTLWKERIHQKAEEEVENTGKEARNVLLVRWAFRFWLESTDRQREYRLSQEQAADSYCKGTVLRRAWTVWLRRYRVEDWAREHVHSRREECLRKIFQAWVKYTKDTVRQEMLQFTTSLSGMDSSFSSGPSPFRSTLGSTLSDTLTSSGYGASVRRGSGSVFTFGARSSERRDDDIASLPGRIDELDNLLRPESPNIRSLSPISILRDSRPVSPLVFSPGLCSPSSSPSPEYHDHHEHHEHHLPITPPVRNEELSPLKSEDDTGIHSGSSDSDHEDDRMSIASFTSFTGHSIQSDMRDREMVATETILHWRNLPLSLTFRTWLKFTRQRKLQKELMNYLKDRKTTELMMNSLATWRRELYTKVTSRQHYLDTTRLRCIKAWHEYTQTKRIQEERKMLADKHCRRKNLKRGFRKWSKKCTSKMKLHHLLGQWQKKAMVTDQDKVSTKKIQELRNVRIVRQTFMHWRQMAKKSQEANRQYTEKLLPKCFAAWHILSSTRVTNRRKEVLFRERRRLTMAFREWQIRFRSFNRAVEFIEIKETDGLLKIVRGWHNWANGMSTRRKEWRNFRRSVELKCMGEIFSDWLNAAQQIIVARRNYQLHMLRSVFGCWKDVALQRTDNRRKMHEFKVNCAANLLARSFQFWQRLLTHTEALRTHRQQHDQDSLRECFQEWRDYTLEIRADKFQVATIQNKMFFCWYEKYSSRKTTRRFIHKWKILTEEAKILNSKAMQFIDESSKRQLQRVFAVWVQEARKIQKANNHAQTKLKTCVLLGLYQFVHRRAEHRKLLREIEERKSLQMLSSSFVSWKERYQRNFRNLEILEGHLEKKEGELKKYCLVKWMKFMLRCKAEKFYHKQLIQKSFSGWWFALYTKKGVEEIREKMLKRKTREAGLYWKQWTKKVRRQSEMAAELQVHHAQRVMQCSFNEWVERTRRMQKATQRHTANVLKRSFVEWKKVVKKTIEMRMKINNFHKQTMKRKVSRMFYEWRETLKVVFKQKQLIDCQMALHDRRMKQGCVREWRKFTLKNRAEKHCNKNLIVKFFLKWKVDTELRLEEKERMQKQEEIADGHYRQTLSKTCFRAWLYDVKVELHLKEQEHHLLEKHYNMWKKRITLNSIAGEMGDRRVYEKCWRIWRHQLIRRRVSELMMKHEEKKQLSEVFMTWYRMTLVRRRLLKEWNLYKTKKLFRLWMQKYNES